MRRVFLLRHSDDGTQTLGHLFVYDGTTELARFATLELPWKNNERNVSCIPAGTYPLRPRTTDKFGAHFALDSVPGRSGILIHTGNFASQIRGCILVGLHHDDLNSDGKLDTARSRIALNQLVQLISDPTTITIVSAEGGEVRGV